MKMAALAVATLFLLSVQAFAQPIGPVKENEKSINADNWPKTVTAPNTLDMGNGRTLRVIAGSARVECKGTGASMTFEVTIRNGSTVVAGPEGNTNSWGDTTFKTGNDSRLDVHGPHSKVEVNGQRSVIKTFGTGGGNLKTGPNATGNTGDIGGDQVGIDLRGGHGNCFRYRGAEVCN